MLLDEIWAQWVILYRHLNTFETTLVQFITVVPMDLIGNRAALADVMA